MRVLVCLSVDLHHFKTPTLIRSCQLASVLFLSLGAFYCLPIVSFGQYKEPLYNAGHPKMIVMGNVFGCITLNINLPCMTFCY